MLTVKEKSTGVEFPLVQKLWCAASGVLLFAAAAVLLPYGRQGRSA